MMHAFQDRLRRLALPVARYWGVHFAIVVGDDQVEVAGMDLRQILVNSRLALASDAEIQMVLLHEWGHRTIAPRSHRAQRAVCGQLVDRHAISGDLAYLVTSIGYDLIVDRWYARTPEWSAEYRPFFLIFFAGLTADLLERHARSANPCKEDLRINLLVHALRVANLDPDAVPEAARDQVAVVSELLQVLFGQDQPGDKAPPASDHDQRVLAFAEAFLALLPERQRQPDARWLLAMVRILDHLAHVVASRAGLRLAAQDGAATRASAGPDSRHKTARGSAVNLDERLAREVVDYLEKSRARPRRVPDVWRESHPLGQLDLKRSYRCAPLLIPGLTTRRLRPSQRATRHPGNLRETLCLVIDDSGSMSGDGARFARSLAEGITRYASRRAVRLALVTFGSDVHTAIRAGHRYGDIRRHLHTLDGNLGGTLLLPAFATVRQWLLADPTPHQVVLITDAKLSDWKKTMQTTQALIELARLTVLVVDTDIPHQLIEASRSHPANLRLARIDTRAAHYGARLEEILP
jgi:Mg-chelatase subunit ChlD